jgi:uncharacterized protein YdhG (YjbR/CyaY superfamily)
MMKNFMKARKSRNKTAMQENVKNYFARFDGIALERLHQIRELVFELLPEAQETVNYGIPTFLYHGNLLHYAAFKAHIGLYPLPETLAAMEEKLAEYPRGKGSIQFPHAKEFPLALIREIVAYRIALARAAD